MAKKKVSRGERLALALKQIREKYPEVRIKKASEVQVEVVTTGIPVLDKTIRGFKRGGYGIIWGPETAGKTSLALKIIAEEQALGCVPFYASIESRFDPAWAQALGVRTSELLLMERGRSLEDNLMAIETIIKENLADTIVIDSLTALVPQQELEDKKDKERTMHDDSVGVQARKFSQWFRRTTPIISQNNTCLILIGQGRMEGLSTTQAKLGLAGGRAQKYYSCTTLKVWRENRDAPYVTENNRRRYLGFIQHVLLDKTSLCANEGQVVRLPFVFGLGYDAARTDVDRAIVDGKIVVNGTWFGWTHPGTKESMKFQGKEKLLAFFREEANLVLLTGGNNDT